MRILLPLALNFLSYLAFAQQLQVSENGRFLVKSDGSPFVWIGDTAWELFHRLDRGEAETYLSERAKKGFNLIQAVVLAELDGLNTPNALGDTPLIDNDPTKPNEDYFDHVDHLVTNADRLGLYMAILQSWGEWVTPLVDRMPDSEMIVKDNKNRGHMESFKGDNYAMIYTPDGSDFQVKMGFINGTKVKAWWFNLRNGTNLYINEYDNKGEIAFYPLGVPALGNDWVLVLDNSEIDFPLPGN